MSDYDNTNRGAIWKNLDKDEDRHPDFKGSLNVNGVDYWVSAWKRKPDASEKAPALSFSIKPKEQGSKPAQVDKQPSTARPANVPNDPFDDDIPF